MARALVRAREERLQDRHPDHAMICELIGFGEVWCGFVAARRRAAGALIEFEKCRGFRKDTTNSSVTKTLSEELDPTMIRRPSDVTPCSLE
jgi:hypothetical protein